MSRNNLNKHKYIYVFSVDVNTLFDAHYITPSLYNASISFDILVKIDQYGTKENAMVLICFQMTLKFFFIKQQ